MLERKCEGMLPKKHHQQARGADGSLHFEHCFTQDGFEGAYTISYHRHRPQAHRIVPTSRGWAPKKSVDAETQAKGLPRKRHFRSQDLAAVGGSTVDCRQILLANEDLWLGVCRPDAPDPIYQINADGDDLIYIHEGGGLVRTSLGDLHFVAGDYVWIPRGLVHRFIPDKDKAQVWLTLDCQGGAWLPRQWRNPVGQLRMDAPYCHRDFRGPGFVGPQDEGIREGLIKRSGNFWGIEWPHSPLDVEGWDGSIFPVAFSIWDFQPRVGRVHLPPTWHGTFACRGGLICSFVPRPVDFDPKAVPCPYPHTSVDCDEVLFYCDGQFTSRRGVGSGSVSLHPAGAPHGPHPGAYEASIGSKDTSELAVMLDTHRPLEVCSWAETVEDKTYAESFFE